ncbi:MAG: hypothetical protein LBI94_09250 [Treponema sp.]|nr:hypothetical protein [Treponema sp.]
MYDHRKIIPQNKKTATGLAAAILSLTIPKRKGAGHLLGVLPPTLRPAFAGRLFTRFSVERSYFSEKRIAGTNTL